MPGNSPTKKKAETTTALHFPGCRTRLVDIRNAELRHSQETNKTRQNSLHFLQSSNHQSIRLPTPPRGLHAGQHKSGRTTPTSVCNRNQDLIGMGVRRLRWQRQNPVVDDPSPGHLEQSSCGIPSFRCQQTGQPSPRHLRIMVNAALSTFQEPLRRFQIGAVIAPSTAARPTAAQHGALLRAWQPSRRHSQQPE